jgi:LacI family transcriptional regulator
MTRKKIQAFARKHGYRPNYFAQNIRRKRSNTIGLIVPTIDSEFFSKVISSIENVTNEKNFHIIIYQTHESLKQEEKIIENLLSLQVCGLIACFSNSRKLSEYLEKFNDQKIPVVLFDRISKEEGLPVNKIVFDNYKLYKTITVNLIQAGRRKFGFFSGIEDVTAFENRISAFTDTLAKFNIPIDESLIFRNMIDTPAIELALNKCLKKYADTIIITNEKTYIETVLMIKKRKLKIPEKILPVGSNNHIISGLLEKQIPTILFHPEKMGRRAAEILISNIGGGQGPFPITEIIETELINFN